MTSQADNKDISVSQEEEMKEMKQRLTEADFYEDGMTLDQMRDIINVLDESRKNAEESSAHQIAQPRTPSVSPPIEGPVNISPPKTPNENNTEAPKMSYSNATKSNKSSTGNGGHERRESTEGNSTSEPTDRTSPKEHTFTPKVVKDQWDKREQRRKKLNLDPLRVTPNENDIPLLQPERPLVVESEPFSFCNDLKNSEFTPKELVQKVSDYLQEVRDEWISHIRIEADESEFQWGSPIKVGSRNFNLDKKSERARNEPEVVEQVRESRSRASKRKAASLIASINNVSDSDGEPDDESSLLKKRKSQQEGRSTSGSNMQMDVDEPKPSEMPSTSSSFANATRIEVSEDDEDIFEPRDQSKSPKFFQPKRVVPPNPGTNKARRGRGRGGKGSFKGPRAKKSTESANKPSETEASSAKKNPPPEICLDNDDVEFDDLSKPTDIKMLKLPMQERTNLAKQRLDDIKNQEKQRIEARKFYEIRSEEEKQKEREELVKKRLLEEERTRRLAKEKEEKENEKKKKWNKVLNESVKQKKEKPKGLTDEEVRRQLEEDDVVVCEEDQPSVHIIGSTSENRVSCPICNKHFPESDIENHASGCNQFEFVEEDISSPVIGSRRRRNNANKQKCKICDKYETYDPNDYIEHIQICIEEDQNRKTSMVSLNEIEYQGQFPAGRRNFNPKGRRYN